MRPRRALSAAAALVLAASAAVGAGAAWADDYFDEQGNPITQEEYEQRFGPPMQVAPEEDAVAPEAQFYSTNPNSRQDGL